ncbi:MAG TPA: hypothetical protein VJI73_01915 [Candidatus Paceibacterota bacterium]
MGFLNLISKKKVKIAENIFVGRHQQVCLVKDLLGEEVHTLNWQIAKNKDLSERNEILEKTEDLENYIKSEFYTTSYDVATTFDKIREIIRTGYESCVLQNDIELEKRCMAIYKNCIDYANDKGERDGSMTDEQVTDNKGLLERMYAIGLLSIIDGGRFDSPLEYHAWLVYFSLQPNPYTKEVIVTILSGVKANRDVLVSGIKLASAKLLENHKISRDDETKINEMIVMGNAGNEKTHMP